MITKHSTPTLIQCNWQGPCGWPKYNKTLPPLPETPGVYLQTIEYKGGYLIYATGITRRSILRRFQEHTHNYENGIYYVLDIAAMKARVRKEIWQGFWTGERTPELLADYKRREEDIQRAAHSEMEGFRVFAADVGTQERTLERIEAAIMNTLYNQPSPFCDIPDRGMFLSPRLENEAPIAVMNKCAVRLHGLPEYLEI